MEAGFPEEDFATRTQPLEHLGEQIQNLLLTQIHQQPVREDHINTEEID
jgi:hypothetical protein